MTKHKPATSLLLPLGDLILVTGVFMLGYWLRHFLLPDQLLELFNMPVGFRLPTSHYLVSGLIMGVIEMIMLQTFGVYRQAYGLAHIEELAWILRSSFLAMVVTLSFSMASGNPHYSRFVLVFAFLAASIAVAVWHWFCRRIIQRSARKKGQMVRVAFYGNGILAQDLTKFIRNKSSVPYEIIGYIQPPNSKIKPVLNSSCDAENMFSWLRENSVSELIIADTTIPGKEMNSIICRCEQEGIAYKLVADLFSMVNLTTRVVHMGGTTMIESVPPPLGGITRIIKRSMDLVIAIPILLVFLPLGFLISLAILIDSGFPVFYVHIRLSRNNKPFKMFKFRSMRAGAHSEKGDLEQFNESSGPVFRMKKDPRITFVGRYLRKWSLDEMPQLINVILGQMSLVGPRPPLPEEVTEHYTERHLKRLQTVPGMTGIVQIFGRRDLDFEEMVKLDLHYVDNWSIWIDLAILILTIPTIFSRKGAY